MLSNVPLRPKATSFSTFGWPSFKLIACTRGMRPLTCRAASWWRCPTAPQADSLTGMETWCLHSKWKQLIQTELLVNSVFPVHVQSPAGLTDLSVAPGVPPSASTAVNKKVSAWLQQSHQPDACTQGKHSISTNQGGRRWEFKSRWNNHFPTSHFWIFLMFLHAWSVS